MLSGEATTTNYIVFGLTRPGLEPTIYCTRSEHANHYATDAVINDDFGEHKQTSKYNMVLIFYLFKKKSQDENKLVITTYGSCNFGVCILTSNIQGEIIYIYVVRFFPIQTRKSFHQISLIVYEDTRFSSKSVNSNPDHGEVYSIQHYVIKFVSDLRQVGGFLRVIQFPPQTKLTDII